MWCDVPLPVPVSRPSSSSSGPLFAATSASLSTETNVIAPGRPPLESEISSAGDLEEEYPCPDVSTALLDDPDLAVIRMDRLSNGASDPFRSPSQAAAVDAQVAAMPHYSDISAQSSPSVIPDTNATLTSTRPPSPVIESDPDVVLLDEGTVPPP